jgi:diguanylate cyclase (GGDEF)-like protein
MPPTKRVTYRSLICIAVGLIGLAVIAIGFVINSLRQDAIADTKTEISNIAAVLAEQTSRSVQAIDLVMVELQDRFEAHGLRSIPDFRERAIGADTHYLLRERLARLPQADVIAFLDANGDTVNSSRSWPPAPFNASQRDYFRYFKSGERHGIYISELLLNGITGHKTVFFSRRINADDGRFLGIVLIGVKLSYFQHIYDSLTSLRNLSLLFLRTDGTILVRYPEIANSSVTKMPADSPWHRVVAAGGGAYSTEGIYDNGARLIAARPLRDYPLVVNVAVSGDAALANWRRRAIMIGVGTLLAILCSAFLLKALSTQFRRLIASETSIKEREASLEEANTRVDAALNNMTQGLCMFDAQERLVVCNERYLKMYDLPADIVKPGCSLAEILKLRKAAGNFSTYIDTYLAGLRRQFAHGEYIYMITHLDDGRVIALQNQAAPGGGWVATHEDITERQRAEARIAHMARHDALTDLANRVLFREKMDEALTRLSRKGEGFSVFVFDLDQFKAVNDTLGHPVGDALLKAVARRLQGTVREGDTVSRLGGDEFAILQQCDTNHRQEAVSLAERLIRLIGKPYEIEGHEIVIGISIGIAIAPDDGTDATQLLKNADLALYRAKSEGRNDYRFFEDKMDTEARARRALEMDLRNAILHEEFEVHYQSIINVASLRTCCVEALVRWRHPERGLISPDKFIPLSEEIGLIGALGEWILRKACTDATAWPDHVKLAVNLSAAQFRGENLVGMVERALAASKLPVGRLELEITESVLLQKNAGTLDTLHRLKALGLNIVLDDFGTGYSSLSYLRMFPFDKIKIDKSFVQEMPNRADCAAIVSAVTSLGRSLQIDTTAEGVETAEQFTLLQAAGCTQAQGYLFSKPKLVGELNFGPVAMPDRKIQAA